MVQRKLASFNEIPDYNSYLVYILAKMPQEDPYTRAIAGLTLKNNIRSFFNTISIPVLDYVKETCIKALQSPDPDPNVRKTIGSVITAIVTRGQVHNWPHILELLLQQLDSPDPSAVEIAFNALGKICEDAAADLDQEIDGVRPLNHIIPKLITFFHNPNPSFRQQAMAATSQFIILKSQSLLCCMDQYLQGLFSRATDDSPDVRQQICRSLVMVLESRPDKLEPNLQSVIEYMIFSTDDVNEQVALEACDFWPQFADIDDLRECLIPYLERIVPVLLKRMVYSEDDLMQLGADDEDAHIADNEQDIKPRFYRAKNQSRTETQGQDANEEGMTEEEDEDEDEDDIEDEEEDDFDDDEFYSEWTLRKCSAAALDVLSSTYGTKVTYILLPLLNHNLFSENWKERECGILALGAAAEGGIDGIAPYLPQMMLYLISSLNDAKPLIRSIACWAIGRFSQWIVEQAATPEGRGTFFEPVLFGMLGRILDKNKRVQEAACSAFATLEEEATVHLIPYLEPILKNLTVAFQTYQHKNLLIAYDALGTLAESVDSALNHPQYLSLIMPPLIAKWNSLTDQDKGLFPLLECLSSVTTALGTGFIPFAGPVFARCVKLIAATLHQIFLAHQQPAAVEPPDVEFIVVALDLLSGMVQGLGPAIDPFVASSDPSLMSLLQVCIHDPVTDILQSTYALIGDLSIACFDRLVDCLPVILPELIQQIAYDFQSGSVCNNAVWAGGEIAIRWRGEIETYVQPMMERLLPLLINPEAPTTLQENVVIAIGRLGLACPAIVAPHLPQFVSQWLVKSTIIREHDEKDTAFRGLCEMIKTNPQAVSNDLSILLDIIAKWQRPSPELQEGFNNVLMGYKNMLTSDQWQQAWRSLSPENQQILTQRFYID
ncbi:hypothetical protein DFQ28_001171 [Apophysomyces sp. BC1034]|nr:hypothetical protein DFQ29_006024 [Apophysomyces sp. BC1021]KAG0190966.1 hypothetical protein DFQ28_001171 [Apophysomyces sp. BC1034]